MKKVITVLALVLAFSSAQANKGKATKVLDGLKSNKSTAEVKQDAKAAETRKEVSEAAKDKRAAIEKLSKEDSKLSSDLVALKKTATNEHFNTTVELLTNIEKADRTSTAQALKNLGAGGELVEARKSLMGLSNALLVELKGDAARANVAIAAAKAANQVLSKTGDFVKAELAARETIEKETGKKVSRKELAERCKRG